MALQDVLDNITFGSTTPFPTGQEALLRQSITDLYNGSAKAKAILDKISTEGLTIDFKSNDARASFTPNAVLIDATLPGKLGMIDETGTAVEVTLDRVVIHEIIHAIENVPDEPDIRVNKAADFKQIIPLSEYRGSTVILTNEVMDEMGEATGRLGYHSMTSKDRLPIGTELSSGETVDAGFYGSDLDMSLSSSSTKDILFGSSANDKLNGAGGRDFLWGNGGNDQLTGGAGNDVMEGGAGTDTAIFTGNCSDYTVTVSNGLYTVTDTRSGALDGVDTIRDVEYARFADGTGLFDQNGIACPGQNVVLAIDVSGSMGDEIDAVKNSAQAIVDAIFGTTQAPLNSRFAIITFNDRGALRTELAFTDQDTIAARKQAAIDAINNVSILGGGVEPLNQAVINAASGAAGAWTAGATANRIIVFSDEPAGDPSLRGAAATAVNNIQSTLEQPLTPSNANTPGSNFFNDVFDIATPEAAPDIDGQVVPVVIGNDFSALQDAEDLAAQTGGQVVTAATANDVVAALLQAVNIAPVAAVGDAAGDEDNAISGTLVATDVDNDPLTFAIAAGGEALNGTVVVGAGGSFTYTPNADFNGTDSFTFEVSDGNLTDTAVVTLTVNPVNDAPVAPAGKATGDEDATITGALAASDVDSEALTFALVANGGVENGTLAVGEDGAFTYTPNADFNGTDSFTYEVSDGELTDTAVVTLTVNPVNDAPVATAGAAAGDEDTAIIGVLEASDIDSEALTFTLAPDGNAATGLVSVGEDGAFTYTPNADFNGTDSFTYEVSDGELTDTAVVTLTVNPVNDAPVAAASAASGDEDSVIAGALAASDVDSETLTFALASDGGASNGAVSLGADGSFTYTPSADFNGTDAFSYVVSDGELTDTAAVTLTVSPANDAPVATAGAAVGDEDTAITGVLAASDVDGEALTFTLAQDDGPANGVVSVEADGSFTYTPNADFNGADSFTYEVSDGAQTDTAVVTITVNPVNDLPTPTEGPDRLSYGDADDTVRALAGDDTVLGGDGDDRIIGQSGNDRLVGQAGNDFAKGNAGADFLKGGGGDDTLIGGGGDDSLRGNGDNDSLKGGGGGDDLKGGGGDDTITGNGGADDIKGGGGNDVINAGRGNDIIKGNGGADIFQFRAGDGSDTINSFQRTLDLIEITGGASEFADLDISQNGRDLLIEFANVEITLTNRQLSQIDEDNFLFS